MRVRFGIIAQRAVRHCCFTLQHLNTPIMRLHILLLSFASLLTVHAHAQWGTAPDFTVTDIDGNTHSLYADILDEGKIAVVQIVATWCPPCWNIHTTGALQQLHEAFGPDGTDQLRVIVYEADPSTSLAALMGSTRSSRAPCNSCASAR